MCVPVWYVLYVRYCMHEHVCVYLSSMYCTYVTVCMSMCVCTCLVCTVRTLLYVYIFGMQRCAKCLLQCSLLPCSNEICLKILFYCSRTVLEYSVWERHIPHPGMDPQEFEGHFEAPVEPLYHDCLGTESIWLDGRGN